MFVLFYSPVATSEITEAAKWYNSQQDGLGDQFLNELEHLVFYIGLNPGLFPQKLKSVRQAPLKRFPYVVLFIVEQKQVFIISVFNCHQNPKKKKSRLK
jgi:hypothetical protein